MGFFVFVGWLVLGSLVGWLVDFFGKSGLRRPFCSVTFEKRPNRYKAAMTAEVMVGSSDQQSKAQGRRKACGPHSFMNSLYGLKLPYKLKR